MRIPSGPLHTEASRWVTGEEFWSELANIPASRLTSCETVISEDRHRDRHVASLPRDDTTTTVFTAIVSCGTDHDGRKAILLVIGRSGTPDAPFGCY